MIQTTVKVEGMMCPMCEKHVTEAIQKAFPEATEVKASHVEGKVDVTSPAALDADTLMKTINEITQDYHNYYEPSHYVPRVAAAIMDKVYADQ